MTEDEVASFLSQRSPDEHVLAHGGKKLWGGRGFLRKRREGKLDQTKSAPERAGSG